MQLGKLGIWINFEGNTALECVGFAKKAEQWGYSALWHPESFGRDGFAHSAYLLANTSSLIVATGIANIYARDSQAMRAGQLTLSEQSGNRFLLGIGVSHSAFVSKRGHDYGKPVATMREYLDGMKQAVYVPPRLPEPPQTVLAALGPKMLELSRDAADGAHPYNVSPAHTREARRILGPGKLLCVEQKLLYEKSSARARDLARQVLAPYLHLPNYVKNWKRFGLNDGDFESGGSDRLVDDTIAWGSEAELIERIEAHWEAGADHVCIQAIDAKSPRSTGFRSDCDENLVASLACLNR